MVFPGSECFNVSTGIHATIAVSLIIAGNQLMTHPEPFSRGFGAFSLGLGYFLLGVTASGQRVDALQVNSKRYLLAVGSAVAIVAGTFLMYYHIQKQVDGIMQGRLAGYDNVRAVVLNTVPIATHVLVYAGYIGLVMAISVRSNNSINYTKLTLSVLSVAIIAFTKNNLLDALVQGQEDVSKHQLAHLLSWALLIVAMAFTC